MIGERIYVKATVTINDADNSISVSAFAREDETKKGMDLSQVTGSTSSYARKYALNGLFCIDDTKDSDSTNTHEKEKPVQTVKISQEKIKTLDDLIIQTKTDINALLNSYKIKSINDMTEAQYSNALKVLKAKLEKSWCYCTTVNWGTKTA